MKRLLITLLAAAGLLLTPSIAQASVSSYNHQMLNGIPLKQTTAFHYPESRPSSPHWLTAEYSAVDLQYLLKKTVWHVWAINYFLKSPCALNQGDDLTGFTIRVGLDCHVCNPGGGYQLLHGLGWFSTVFAHEFAHVVSLKAYRAHSEGTFVDLVGGLYENKPVPRAIRSQSHGTCLEVPIADLTLYFGLKGAEYWSAATIKLVDHCSWPNDSCSATWR